MDSSAWIDVKEIYPFDVFPSLWNELDTLIQEHRLISPEQVYEELRKKDDEIFRWVKQRKRLFRELDQEQVALAKEIIARFPKLIDPQKEIADADPFVISLAVVEARNLTMLGGQCIVVSQEKAGGSTKVKIPDVCMDYNIEHFYLVEFFKKEKWKF